MVGKDGRQIDRVEVALRRHGHLAATVGPTEMIVIKHDKYVKLPLIQAGIALLLAKQVSAVQSNEDSKLTPSRLAGGWSWQSAARVGKRSTSSTGCDSLFLIADESSIVA